MSEPLDESYLRWLYSQVASVKTRNPSRTYWSLMRFLFKTEFVWLVANDDNRLEDGRDLRRDFLAEEGITDPDEAWVSIGCSLLEMLLGLSKRLVFESENSPSVADWFWHLMHNINLSNFNDAHVQSEQHEDYIKHVLETVVWRNYRSDGFGGLFPLRNPREDQRQVELWYQLSNYLLEGHKA